MTNEVENEKPLKKILSIDGGGIKGVFPISLLVDIEEHIDGRIYEYFDLISGTSTGGIIALGLALGIAAKDILNLYVVHGPDIFKGYIKSNGRINFIRKFSKLCGKTLYANDGLKYALESVFSGYRIGDCKTRVLIPSFNITANKIHVFKTAHHPTLMTDYKSPVMEAAISTSAAPVYLPAYKAHDHNIYLDGGIGANNPVGIAVVEGITKCGWQRDEIAALSLGCMETTSKINSHSACTSGLQFINPQILTDAFMNVESQYSEGIASLLINDKNRYLRINHNDGTNQFELDGVTKKQIESLIGIGKETARYNKTEILTKFFSNKTEKFDPFYKL